MKSPRAKYYVVWKGRKTGVFATWEECAAQVQGFPGAQYKAFSSRAIAERAFLLKTRSQVGNASSSAGWLFAPERPIADSLAVDAACSGNPGRLEFRAVHTSLGKTIFRKGPYRNGTNNIGEFLALVHALAYLKVRNSPIPVYTDSLNAIAWVRAGKCRTRLERNASNASLFDLVEKAEVWLRENGIPNSILKWDTAAWGEIPADFNRK